MLNHRYRRLVGCALIAGLALPAATGCSRAATGGPESAGVAAAPSAPSTISTAEAAPKAGAPAWCGTIDSPAVTALYSVLPELATGQAASAAPKVRAAATVLRDAATSAPAGPGQLLTDAADSLDQAAAARSAASLQAVGTAFDSLSKGVQGTCGFH